jgi:Holliday junction resolvase RusA-like endonuclease
VKRNNLAAKLIAARKAAEKSDPRVSKPAKIQKKEEIRIPKNSRRHQRVSYEGPEFIVELNLTPQPKERARTFMDEGLVIKAFVSSKGDIRTFMGKMKSKGKDGNQQGVMKSLTPEATRKFEDAARLMLAAAMTKAGYTPFSHPLEMDVVFRIQGNPDTWPDEQADGDLDNHMKSLKDAMNKTVYEDDRLVVRMIAEKRCAPIPGISVIIRPASPDQK